MEYTNLKAVCERCTFCGMCVLLCIVAITIFRAPCTLALTLLNVQKCTKNPNQQQNVELHFNDNFN